MSYSEKKKNSKYFDYTTCLFRPSPPLSEKIWNRQTPPRPLVRKNQKLDDSPPPLGGWHGGCERPLTSDWGSGQVWGYLLHWFVGGQVWGWLSGGVQVLGSWEEGVAGFRRWPATWGGSSKEWGSYLACCEARIQQPWIQRSLDSTILDSTILDSTTLTFNDPWIQQA